MALDLGTLTTDQLLALKAQLDGPTDTSGRSPFKPRQLHDLRLLPTKDDPRPTFFASAEPPRNAGDLTRTKPYPKLLWHAETGQEITVTDRASEETYTASGYLQQPPEDVVIDPMDLLAQQLDALSEADRALLIESQRQDRIAQLRAQLVSLPEDKLAALLASSGETPAKRKPGRPRKESVA